MDTQYRGMFSKNLDLSLSTGISLLRDFPLSANALLSIYAHQKKARKVRDKWEKEGVVVPPLLIVSTTQRCNLHCKGCYAGGGCASEIQEMSSGQMDTLMSQAVEAGCSMVLLAGGEPLLCRDWLEALAASPSLLGLVFTNGTLFDEEMADWFCSHRSLLPLFSIEGDDDMTDSRRGGGVSAQIRRAMVLCHEARLPFGVSVTTGGHNIETVTAPGFIDPYISLGCRIAVHVEYVPVDESDELYALSQDGKSVLDTYCNLATRTKGALFVAFPGDEAQYDGCLAAGRGFAHVNASGALEPCPFAPYSDSNVCRTSLIEALKSPLFSAVREDSRQLHEGAGGCALRTQGKWMTDFLTQD